MDCPPKTAPKVVGTAQHTGRLVNEPQWRSGGLRRAKRWKNVSTGPIKNGSSQKKIDNIIPKIRQPFEQSCTTHSSQWFGKQGRRQASILGQKQCERQEKVGPKSQKVHKNTSKTPYLIEVHASKLVCRSSACIWQGLIARLGSEWRVNVAESQTQTIEKEPKNPPKTAKNGINVLATQHRLVRSMSVTICMHLPAVWGALSRVWGQNVGDGEHTKTKNPAKMNIQVVESPGKKHTSIMSQCSNSLQTSSSCRCKQKRAYCQPISDVGWECRV